MVRNDPRHDVPANQDATHVKTWVRGPTRARNQNNRSQSLCHWQVGPGSDPQTKVQGRWAHWGFGQPSRPANLPLGPTTFRFHLEVSHWLLMVVWWGSTAAHPVAPSYKYKGGGRGMNTHTSHPLNSPFSLGAWGLHPRGLGRLGGVEEEKESEEESGEVPGLSALFSACTSTDAYSVVSVRDFLCLFIWN